jgi:hypothetical protein
MTAQAKEIVAQEVWNPPAMVGPTPMEMLAQAIEKGMSPEVIGQMMSLAERWEANRARKAFDAAIAAAKAEIPPIIKNRVVDFTSQKGRTHYKHEDLAEIARTVDPILARYGLSYRFRTRSEINEPIRVTCILSHRDGHSEENTLCGPRDETGNKNAHQAIASAMTLMQRYSLKAALGLSAAEVDDDGRAAGAKEPERKVITEEQVMQIRDLLLATDSDEAKFCQRIKVPSLADIFADSFDAACAVIRQKMERRAG